MRLKPFLLDMWLDSHMNSIEFNLAASTGPQWTVNELLNLAGAQERERYRDHGLGYSCAAGAEGLREAIAEMQGVGPECVEIVTGGSEALLILMWLAAEPGANVIVPKPGYTAFSTLPESLGIETRFYAMRKEDAFAFDVEAIMRLADQSTKLIIVNSPHNPTGATISDIDLERLHAFALDRKIQLVCDDVYHPIYHGRSSQSAARLPGATVVSDFSKAFSMGGLRTGWMIERDHERRERYLNARAYFSASNTPMGEILAEIAMHRRDAVLARTQEVTRRNLEQLDGFMARHEETLRWVRPQGGTTAFPWLRSGQNTRAFCVAATERGVLLVPGDCFDQPQHLRIGFGASEELFAKALHRLEKIMAELAAA